MAAQRWRSGLIAFAALLWLPAAAPAAFEGSGAATELLAARPPPGFEETIALSGLTNPTAVRFAPGGRIFVAEKGGLIKVFYDFGDPTPEVYADLSNQVHDYWDRGLLGLALDRSSRPVPTSTSSTPTRSTWTSRASRPAANTGSGSSTRRTGPAS